MKRIKIAIIILAAAIVAAIGIFFIANYFNDKSIEESEAEDNKLRMSKFNNDNAKKIDINIEGKDYVIEYIKGSGWELTNTDEFLINDAIPSAICSSMSNLTAVRILDSTDKSRYGLNEPTKVTVYADDEAYTVLIGDPTPTYENFYAMKENDDKIYLIEFTDGSVLSPTKDDLKFRYLYPYSFYNVTGFTLWNGAETDENIVFSMANSTDSGWSMVKPYEDDSVYSTQITTFLNRTSADSINSFVQENCTEADYSKYGFDDPKYVFEISTADETTKVIFGDYTNNDTEIYALYPQSGQVVTFLSNGVTTLGFQTLDMMNTPIFSTYITRVVSVELKMPDAEATMTISGSEQGYALNENKVDENAEKQFVAFFDSFNTATAEATEFAKEPTSDEAALTIRYTLTNNVLTDINYIPVPGSDNYWVTRDGGYTGYVVNKSVIDKIISSYDELVKAVNP